MILICPVAPVYTHTYTHAAKNQRGLHISRNTGANEIIMEIPEQCLLSSDVARQSDLGQTLVKAGFRPRYVCVYVRVFTDYWCVV